MNSRTIRLLHVEDDTMQQMIIARHLTKIPELSFAITCVRSEEEAVTEFRGNPRDFVIIDYHLSEGNGLNCLRSLRQQDAIVPIIAVSGQATNEIAAQLLESGADDYISKRELRSDILARSVQLALARSDVWRRRHAVGSSGRVGAALRQICKRFATIVGPDFLRELEEFDAAVSATGLTNEQLSGAFETVRGELMGERPSDSSIVERSLRPILLELKLRLAEATKGP